jgi:hypothetical protein
MTEREISEMLRRAVSARVAAIRNAEGSEPKTFKFECVQCGATNSVTEEDDESYRTSPETSETGNDDDENTGDDDGDDFEDRAAKLAARLLKAANKASK